MKRTRESVPATRGTVPGTEEEKMFCVPATPKASKEPNMTTKQNTENDINFSEKSIAKNRCQPPGKKNAKK